MITVESGTTFANASVTERVLAGLGEAFAERAGDLLPSLVDGFAVGLSAVDDRLAPTARGWARVFDLDSTPDPRWLGAVTGTRITDGTLSRPEVRDLIRSRPAWRRGTPAALEAAVRAALVGDQRVTLIERDGSPWALTVQVYISDLPAGGVDPVKAAIATQKPVGIVATLDVIDGSTYAHMATVHGPAYTDFETDFATYADARDHLPEA